MNNNKSKWFDIGVEKDHIDSLTKVTGVTALSELIWNSLDADATKITIEINTNLLGNNIIVRDNGIGIPYDKAIEAFKRIGGSEKKNLVASSTGRQLHGKEGKGRYRSLALGDRVTFRSTYKENGTYFTFSITIDRNNLARTTISELNEINKWVKDLQDFGDQNEN